MCDWLNVNVNVVILSLFFNVLYCNQLWYYPINTKTKCTFISIKKKQQHLDQKHNETEKYNWKRDNETKKNNAHWLRTFRMEIVCRANLPSGSWSPVRSQSNNWNPMNVDNLTSMQAWNWLAYFEIGKSFCFSVFEFVFLFVFLNAPFKSQYNFIFIVILWLENIMGFIIYINGLRCGLVFEKRKIYKN